MTTSPDPTPQSRSDRLRTWFNWDKSENTAASNERRPATVEEFIYFIERRLERLNKATLDSRLDRTVLPNYSVFFSPFPPPEAPQTPAPSGAEGAPEPPESAPPRSGGGGGG